MGDTDIDRALFHSLIMSSLRSQMDDITHPLMNKEQRLELSDLKLELKKVIMDAKTSEWVVDDYLDVSGAYIIRIADSSINDNCKDQLIATVYEKELADLIVDTHNASLEKHV